MTSKKASTRNASKATGMTAKRRTPKAPIGSEKPFDPHLLTRARTQWQFGDWQSLAQLAEDQHHLAHHPQRAELRILATAGALQSQAEPDAAVAKAQLKLSMEEGASREAVARMLIAGVYNSLGRASAISQQQVRSQLHFEKGIEIGMPGAAKKLVTHARATHELESLGLVPGVEGRLLNFPIRNASIQDAANKGFFLVNSIPKSGTYFVALLLSELGLTDSGLHFRNDRYWDFKNKPLDEIIADPDQYLVQCDLRSVMNNIDSGEFCVGHLEYDRLTDNVLNELNVRQVFLVRNLRDSLVSSMRFIADKRRKKIPAWACQNDNKKMLLDYLKSSGAKYLRSFIRQANWADKSDVLVVRYEDLIGGNGEHVRENIVNKLMLKANIKSDLSIALEIINDRVMGKKTRTFSGRRSRYTECWSGEAEAIFRDHLGCSLNQRFGYE